MPERSSGIDCLLLLPPVPTDADPIAWQAAFGPALARFDQILREDAHKSKSRVIADIVVLQTSKPTTPRSRQFQVWQSCIAGVYRLLLHIRASEQTNVRLDSLIDVRVMLAFIGDLGDDESILRYAVGPIFPLRAIAGSPRAWHRVFGVESEAGESFLQRFAQLRREQSPPRAAFEIERLPGGPIMRHQAATADLGRSSQRQHFFVAVGGTFDHLHIGHKLLLTASALVLDPSSEEDKPPNLLTIGITGDAMLKKKQYASLLEDWNTRQAQVAEFLHAIMDMSDRQWQQKVTSSLSNDNQCRQVLHAVRDNLSIRCIEILDAYGPTITEESISALVLSGETSAGGTAINDKRRGLGWSEVDVFEVDVLDASPVQLPQQSDTKAAYANKISSTAIRQQLHEQ